MVRRRKRERERGEAKEPIRANFDDEVPRNISRSQLPAGPQRESTAKVAKIARATSVALNFYASLSCGVSREVWRSCARTRHSSLLPEGITFSFPFYAARSRAGYQFALSRMNFYGARCCCIFCFVLLFFFIDVIDRSFISFLVIQLSLHFPFYAFERVFVRMRKALCFSPAVAFCIILVLEKIILCIAMN